ncbi:helix-turn-helix domain-containing protein [Bifidobacterium callitrichos]|nr:helix-turn-helix transcriptional regulator [Bifidobacterium callitrichos]
MFDKSNIGAAMGRMSSEIQSIRQLTVALRDARVMQKLTQEELAQRTGLTRPWINQFEQGKIANASISRILLLCRELGVTFTVSYNVPEQSPTTPNHSHGISSTRPDGSSDGSSDGSAHRRHMQPLVSDEIVKAAQQLQPLAGFSMEPYFSALQRLSSTYATINSASDDAATNAANTVTSSKPKASATGNENTDEDQST